MVKTATTILALYNEAKRAGLIEYLKDKRRKFTEQLVINGV
jgi:hypothetical protein